MSKIKCINWLVSVGVILINKTVKQVQGDTQHFSENFGQDGYSNGSP